MKTIKVDFKNFWKLNYQNDVTIKFIKHFFSINNIELNITNKNPDIIFYSVFFWEQGKYSFPERDLADSRALKILFTRENLYSHRYTKTYLPNLYKFDFVLGFEDNIEKKHYEISNYLIIGQLYNEYGVDYQLISKNLVENIEHKNKNICLISKNPHKLRIDILNKFKNNNIIVDCPSKVGNNMKMPVDNNKIKFLSNYFFNICPENSYAPGYTTEKLYDAMISGCIPIYWGCDRLGGGFFNKEKIFFIKKDLSNFDTIIDEATILLNSKNKLLNHICMNPFGENRLDIINDQNKKIKNIFKQIIDTV